MKSDRHVHTPFCPHGTTDTFIDYISRGIELGLKEITFTEHAPLPPNFHDPTPDKDSGMDPALLLDYFRELQHLKEHYKGKILIKRGLEIDFIEGYEKETSEFLHEVGEFLDDSILSVHFLKQGPNYHCLDFSEDAFENLAAESGSIEAVYSSYYDTLEKAIQADLGPYKPKRIGHITLVHKFQHRFRPVQTFDERVYRVLDLIKEQGYSLDYNGAGFIKPLCREPYPPERFARRAMELEIPLVYGSDAHQAKDLGQGFDSLIPEFKDSFT